MIMLLLRALRATELTAKALRHAKRHATTITRKSMAVSLDYGHQKILCLTISLVFLAADGFFFFFFFAASFVGQLGTTL